MGDISKRDALQAALNLVLNGKTNEGVKQLDDLIGRELERYFVRKGVPPEDAEEMVWELFLRAVKPGSGYRGDAPAEHWINTCKKRMVIDYWRSRKLDLVNPGVDDDGEDRDPFEGIAAAEIDEALTDCIARAFAAFAKVFPDRAIQLTWIVEEWTNEEIAEALKVNLGAARDRIYQTRKKLDPYVRPCVGE